MLKLMYDALMKNGRVYVDERHFNKFIRYARNRKTNFNYEFVNVGGIDMVKFTLKKGV